MNTSTPTSASTDATAIRAVVFDWAGTIVDFGSLAPMGAFVRLFANHGIQISIAQARAVSRTSVKSRRIRRLPTGSSRTRSPRFSG